MLRPFIGGDGLAVLHLILAIDGSASVVDGDCIIGALSPIDFGFERF
jgi:hypothetical protein